MKDKREEIIKRIIRPPVWSDWEYSEFVLCSECKHGCKRGGKYSGCHQGTKEQRGYIEG